MMPRKSWMPSSGTVMGSGSRYPPHRHSPSFATTTQKRSVAKHGWDTPRPPLIIVPASAMQNDDIRDILDAMAWKCDGYFRIYWDVFCDHPDASACIRADIRHFDVSGHHCLCRCHIF